MIAAIKYNLKHLTDFGGRDARQTFWFYVLFLVVAQFLIGMISVIPSLAGMIDGAIDVAGSGGSEEEIQAAMAAQMGGMLSQQVWISAVGSVASCLLLLAAFVRRLHDAGFSGWIAAIPLAITLFAAWQSVTTIDEVIALAEVSMTNPDLAAQQGTSLSSLVGWIGYLVVIGFGVLKSQDGPNAYGDKPVSF